MQEEEMEVECSRKKEKQLTGHEDGLRCSCEVIASGEKAKFKQRMSYTAKIHGQVEQSERTEWTERPTGPGCPWVTQETRLKSKR